MKHHYPHPRLCTKKGKQWQICIAINNATSQFYFSSKRNKMTIIFSILLSPSFTHFTECYGIWNLFIFPFSLRDPTTEIHIDAFHSSDRRKYFTHVFCTLSVFTAWWLFFYKAKWWKLRGRRESLLKIPSKFFLLREWKKAEILIEAERKSKACLNEWMEDKMSDILLQFTRVVYGLWVNLVFLNCHC